MGAQTVSADYLVNHTIEQLLAGWRWSDLSLEGQRMYEWSLCFDQFVDQSVLGKDGKSFEVRRHHLDLELSSYNMVGFLVN